MSNHRVGNHNHNVTNNDNDDADIMNTSAPHSHIEGSPLAAISAEDPFAIGQLPTSVGVDPELYDILRMATFDQHAAVANGMTIPPSAFPVSDTTSASFDQYWSHVDVVDAAVDGPTRIKREGEFASSSLTFPIPSGGPSFSFSSSPLPSQSLATPGSYSSSSSHTSLPTSPPIAPPSSSSSSSSSHNNHPAESGPPHTHSRTRSSAHQQHSASPYYAPAKRGGKKKLAQREVSPPPPISPVDNDDKNDGGSGSDGATALDAGDDDDDGKDGTGKGSKKKHSVKVLARKAELARASRRRKKAYVQDLESKVKKLSAKLEEINAKKPKKTAASTVDSEEKERKETQLRLKNKMADLLKRPVDKSVMMQLQGLVASFVGNSRQRQQAVDFYLDRVEDCLSPGLQVKFALWGLDQSDDFYEKPGLWVSLMSKEVGLTPEQMGALRTHRAGIHAERLALQQCEARLKDTRAAIVTHLNGLHRSLDAILSTLTPLQLAKFFVWVESNEWCMQMLDTSVKPNISPTSSSSNSNHGGMGMSSPSSMHTSAFPPSSSSSSSSTNMFDYSSSGASPAAPPSPAISAFGRTR